MSIPSENKDIDLDMLVAPGGANFSQGQKQLLSLARALLRRSAIIVFDESTCSVDTETEAKVRQVLREELEGRLLISGKFTNRVIFYVISAHGHSGSSVEACDGLRQTDHYGQRLG